VEKTYMNTIRSAHRNASSVARDTGRHLSPWIRRLARLGYLARGIVYVVVGVMAVQAGLGTGGETTDSRGALETIAGQPFGQVLLLVLAAGLLGYAVWRFIEAWFDTEGQGSDAKGKAKRIGAVVSGVIHLALAGTAFTLAIQGFASGGGSTQSRTAELMSQPFGQWLVGLLGVTIIVVGLFQAKRGYQSSFMHHLDLSSLDTRKQRWVERLGQAGHLARAVVWAIIGLFFIHAAASADPHQAGGMGEALTELAAAPAGTVLLVVVALGLLAFGLYSGVAARYRRLPL
jgi:hypothetical protein